MGNALRLAMAVSVCLLGAGCTKEREWTGDPRLSRPEVQEVVAQIHGLTNWLSNVEHGSGIEWRDQVMNAIAAISNNTERIALLDELTDCLFAQDVSSLNYRSQFKALDITRGIVERGVFGHLQPRFNLHSPERSDYFEWFYGMLLKKLAWDRAQIVRTMPKHRLENPYVILDMEADKEREAWAGIHYGGIGYYEAHLKYLERSFHNTKAGMPEDLWNRLKEKVEAFLGRPLRSPKQLEDDAVNRRHVEFTEKEDDYAAP